jgi:ElaB/YqjD/DUF883 family membrane-anchored ribosome-binding protein
MKMRMIHRFILVFGALVVMLIGVGLILSLCDLIPFTIMPVPENGPKYDWKRITMIACGVFLTLYGAFAFAFPGKLRYNRKDFIVQKTDNGDLLISVKALETLVRKCVDMHEEIDMKAMKVVPGKNGIIVRLKIAMANNISIPLATESLQKQIKQYVQASSGVEVNNVIVAVETTSGEVRGGASPYQVSSEAEEKKAEREDKKLPHLRMFSREDEPVNMPKPEAEVKPVEAAVKDAAQNAADTAQNAVQEVAQAAKNAADSAEEKAKDVLENAVSGLEEAGDKVEEAVTDAINQEVKIDG